MSFSPSSPSKDFMCRNIDHDCDYWWLVVGMGMMLMIIVMMMMMMIGTWQYTISLKTKTAIPILSFAEKARRHWWRTTPACCATNQNVARIGRTIPMCARRLSSCRLMKLLRSCYTRKVMHTLSWSLCVGVIEKQGTTPRHNLMTTTC